MGANSCMKEITVVIPTYGHANYIAKTLESILAQTRPAREIIVLNDGSPDDTDAAVAPYMDRIRYIKGPHRGLGATVWAGVDLVSTEYTHLIASDDWLEPNAYEVLGAVLDRDLEVGVAHGSRTVVEESGNRVSGGAILGKYFMRDLAFEDAMWVHPVILWRTQALRHAPGFRQFSLSLDWVHWIAAGLDGWYGYGVPHMLGYYRRHATNTSHWTPPIVAEQKRLLRFVRRHYGDRLSRKNRQKLRQAIGERTAHQAWADLSKGRRREARRRFSVLCTFPERRWNSVLGEAACQLPPMWYAWARQQRLRWINRQRRLVAVIKH